MPYIYKLTKIKLGFAWSIYSILILWALLMDAKSSESFEIILSDGKPALIHGKSMGSFVSIGGRAAQAGSYQSHNGCISFEVDSTGYLVSDIAENSTKLETLNNLEVANSATSN